MTDVLTQSLGTFPIGTLTAASYFLVVDPTQQSKDIRVPVAVAQAYLGVSNSGTSSGSGSNVATLSINGTIVSSFASSDFTISNGAVSLVGPTLNNQKITGFDPNTFINSGSVLSAKVPTFAGNGVSSFDTTTLSFSGGAVAAKLPTYSNMIISSFDTATHSFAGGAVSAKLPTCSGTIVSSFDSNTLAINSGVVAAKLPTLGGAIVKSFSSSSFSVDGNGVLSGITGAAGTVLTLASQPLTSLALDPTYFTSASGTLSLTTTAFSSFPLAGTLTAATQILVVIGGAPFYTTLGALSSIIGQVSTPSIAIANISTQTPNTGFVVTGVLSNYSSAPVLAYEDNSGSFTTITGTLGSNNSNTFTLNHPGLTSGNYTLTIKDSNNVSSTSNTFVVAVGVATGATLASVSTTGTQNVAISGATCTITPNGALAYAVLALGSSLSAAVDEGTRVQFAGTSVPSITPQNSGNYYLKLYPASTGGVALVASAAITVAANVIAATAATINTLPSNTGLVGTAYTGATGTITPSNATAYAGLYLNNVLEGTLHAFTGTNIPALTPQNSGAYRIKLAADSNGATILATSSQISVAGSLSPPLANNVQPGFIVDASASNSVTSDSGGNFSTPQTANGGNVGGLKDSTSSAYNFTFASGTGQPTLVTSAQNSRNGVAFPWSNTATGMTGPLSLAQAINTAVNTGGSGVTIAMVLKTGTGIQANIFTIDSLLNLAVGSTASISAPNGSTSISMAPNSLVKVIFVINPTTGKISVNTPAASSGQVFYTPPASGAGGGNISGPGVVSSVKLLEGTGSTSVSNNVVLYEINVWFSPAVGTYVNNVPNGDLGTIFAYLSNKWGSNPVATAATLSGVPSSGTINVPITSVTATLTPSNAVVFAALYLAGVQEGVTYPFTGTVVPNLTPAATGSYTIVILDARSSGNIIVTSSAINVRTAPVAGSAPSLASGAAPVMGLDVTQTSNVTSDAAYTTPQTTNGGVVEGLKDSISSYNFSQPTSAKAPTLVTNSANGKQGINFLASASAFMTGPDAIGTMFRNAIDGSNGTTGLTGLLVFRPTIIGDAQNTGTNIFSIGSQSSSNVTMKLYNNYGPDVRIVYNNLQISGSYYASTSNSYAINNNMLLKVVFTLPGTNTGNMQLFLNNLDVVTNGYDNRYDTNTFTPVTIGQNGAGVTPLDIYEFTLWPGVATGGGGSVPTGDVANIMNYATTKYGS